MPGRGYDKAQRRKAQRRGRQKGCSVYIPAEELAAAGYTADDEDVWYRCWGTKRGGVMVQLYRKPLDERQRG